MSVGSGIDLALCSFIFSIVSSDGRVRQMGSQLTEYETLESLSAEGEGAPN